MTEQVPLETPAPTPATPAPTTPPITSPAPTPEAPKAEPAFTPAAPDSLAAAAPETFDLSALKIPDNFKLADEAKTQLSAALVGVPPERAQALFDLHAAEAQRIAQASLDANVTAWNNINTQWRSEIDSDPVIGGANTPKVKAAISRLVNEFGDGGAGVREALNLTGAGNNPHLVRFFHKVASKLYEGGPVNGSPANGAAPPNMADVFYPSSKG